MTARQWYYVVEDFQEGQVSEDELVDVVAGSCTVNLDGSEEQKTYETGTYFDVAGNSGFDIAVTDGIMEYICP